MNWMLKFLPEDKRNMIELAMRIFSAMDTEKERNDVLAYALKMFDPSGPGGGRVTIAEWGTLGGKLKIMRGPYPKNNHG